MKNNLCSSCDGRGFHWTKGYIIDPDKGNVIAGTYRQGPICRECNGSGKYNVDSSWWFYACLIAALAIIFFGIVPLFRML